MFLIFDILVLCFVVFYFSDKEFLNSSFLLYIISFWIISSFFTGFYKIYRHTNWFRIFTLLFSQFTVFILGYFTYFGLFKEGEIIHNQANLLGAIIVCVSIVKLAGYFSLKKYRTFGLNYRKVIVIGNDNSSTKIATLFKKKKNLGYQFFGFFSDKKTNAKDYVGKIKEAKKYILENEIDEIYCSLTELDNETIKEFMKFGGLHNLTIKLIPNANELYSKNLNIEFYNNTSLILNVKKLPFEINSNRTVKRIFDFFFSLFVICFIMSWLYPLLWILIKLESKGPVIFKQPREGIHGKEFLCYKFRSMKVNELADKIHATKNDVRITKIGAFIRKTSLDELPQFFNVLKGDMSVVGPRPHLESLSIEYQKDVDDYLKRHAVKPGITGLAQVSGYRGEIKKKSDIKNRVRLDIFYIENWSFLLDIKIIFQTVFSVFNGDEKAY